MNNIDFFQNLNFMGLSYINFLHIDNLISLPVAILFYLDAVKNKFEIKLGFYQGDKALIIGTFAILILPMIIVVIILPKYLKDIRRTAIEKAKGNLFQYNNAYINLILLLAIWSILFSASIKYIIPY